MVIRFGNFELDALRHELRLDGAPVELQPLVFQLLLFLVNNRDRVVPKNELLDTVWRDSVVTESSLQRAVSLARTALRRGGMENAIRNVPRAGYQFVGTLLDQPAAEAPDPHPATLETRADEEKWAGRLAQAVPLLEEAIAGYREAGDDLSAVRVMVRLARIQQERLEIAAAAGWLALAARLLEGLPESREHGMHAWMQGELAILVDRIEEGVRHCDRAYEVSRRIKDADLEALAMATRGHGLMAGGQVAAAAGCHQEAAALVLGGGVSAESGGYVMCSVITSAANRGDWVSARQWTEQFTRWCKRFGKSSYPGLCQLHRAEMLHFKGELPNALVEAETAAGVLKEAAPWAEGDAYRVLGDVYLATGKREDAETAYQKAYQMGWDPQPGMAWMHFAAGNAATAIDGLQRSIDSSNWFSRERRALLLAELVTLAVCAGRTDLARDSLAALTQVPDTGLPMQKALLARARSRLAAHDQQYPQALAFMQESRRHWHAIGATLNVGVEHLEAAKVLKAAGDDVAAELELTAAVETFRTAGAAGLVEQCQRLRQD